MNWWLLYALSVCGQVSDAFVIGGIVLFCLSIMAHHLPIHELGKPQFHRVAFCVGGWALVLLGSLVPSNEGIIRAYALVEEGSKVVNADNAEKAAEAVGKRVDHFLRIIKKATN